VTIQIGGSKPPLFCVHAIDGNVLVFQNLARHLDPDQPVYGLQAKGLDGKQAPHTRFEDMAADYIKEIRTVQPEGPYLLAGYSSGGVVAFEMAQQLQAQGQQVELLALIDSYCPVYFNPQSFSDLVFVIWVTFTTQT
jgi:thioesterase domain-containing protein